MEQVHMIGHLWGVECRRHWQQVWSYRLDFLGGMALWLVTFPLMMIIFAGVAGGYPQTAQWASLIGFLVWDLNMGVLAAVTREVAQEAREGTLEPLFLSPVPPLLLFSLRLLAAFVIQAVRTLLLGLLLMVILQLPLTMSGPAFPVLLLTLVGTYGIGLLLGGIALVYKQIASLIGVITLLAVLATGALVPLDGLGTPFLLLKFFVPTAWGIDALRVVLIGGASWWALWQDGTWLGLTIQAIVFTLLGATVFQRGVEQARVQGTLGAY
jgi:ABC-2 type transport system permease protein